MTAGAAGGSVDCVCGRRVAVPALSQLRSLPEVVDPHNQAAEVTSGFIRLSLTIGQIVSLAGCGVSVIVAVLGPLLIGDVRGWAQLPAGIVGFFYSAGMYFVFSRAKR